MTAAAHEAEIVSEAITLADRERAIAWRAVCRRCGWSGPPRLRRGLAEGDQALHAAHTQREARSAP